MQKNLPAWAIIQATPADRLATIQAYEQGTMQTNWDTAVALKAWAKQHDWPTPWFDFQSAFFKKMLTTDEDFALAVTASGLEISIPAQEYTISDADLEEMDHEYEDGDWGSLVLGLRDIRRAIEAGVVVHVDGKTLKSYGRFYNWAHSRYHALEDGSDSWIGDDSN